MGELDQQLSDVLGQVRVAQAQLGVESILHQPLEEPVQRMAFGNGSHGRTLRTSAGKPSLVVPPASADADPQR